MVVLSIILLVPMLVLAQLLHLILFMHMEVYLSQLETSISFVVYLLVLVMT